MYTRDGQFTFSTEKKLVTMDGNPVMGKNGGEMTVEGKDVRIEGDGSVHGGRLADRIKVVDFSDKKL